MRNFITILLVLSSPTMVAPTSVNLIPIELPVKKEVIIIKNMDLFLHDLGHRESGNRYNVVNQFGYMGKYQFGKSTLKTLKIKVTRDAFLNSPDLQEYAMQQNLLYNKKKLQKYIDKFEGQELNGILITESGILAAAHLGGAGSVRKYFRSGKVMEDGNGVKITSYLNQFSGYNLNI
jgi:hypothetical protein|tara:strand:+ start:675 stop:1205 length:531 start_codon:yes stop_codon:yes gene_type:complete